MSNFYFRGLLTASLAATLWSCSDDFDFNDIVFDYTEVIKSYLPYEQGDNETLNVVRTTPNEVSSAFPTIKEVTVTPRAAGGTLPIYVTWKGPVYKPYDYLRGTKVSYLLNNKNLIEEPEEGTWLIGDEIHHWLGGSSVGDMLNTGGSITATGRSCTFITKHDYNTTDNFTIVVDKEGTFNKSTNGAAYVKIDEITGNDNAVSVITKPDKGSSTPQMIHVDRNVAWPTERTPIYEAYTGFNAWVESQENNKDWYTTWVAGNVIDEPGVDKPVVKPETK